MNRQIKTIVVRLFEYQYQDLLDEVMNNRNVDLDITINRYFSSISGKSVEFIQYVTVHTYRLYYR